MEKLEIGKMPDILEKDIEILINAVNSGEKYIDCELSELRADINQCESNGLISSHVAKILRKYYIFGGYLMNKSPEE